MKQYYELADKAYSHGVFKADRTGTGCYSIFGYQARFDLFVEFPMVTLKHTPFKPIFHELKMFLLGLTTTDYLNSHGVKIWNQNADENAAWLANEHRKGPGDLGKIYGYQWRSFPAPVIQDLTLQQRVTLAGQNLTSLGEYGDQAFTDLNLGKATDAQVEWLTGYADRYGVPNQMVVSDGKIDQFVNALNLLKNNPDSRHILVSAWNPAQLDQMALAPCHVLFQFYSHPMRKYERKKLLDKAIEEGTVTRFWNSDNETFEQYLESVGIPARRLSCQLYQRSADIFLGVPFNIASYALLTHMVAQVTGHAVGDFIWTGGDCHLYANHMEKAKEMLSRDIRPAPQLVVKRKVDSIFDFNYEDFELVGYDPHPAMPAPMAV